MIKVLIVEDDQAIADMYAFKCSMSGLGVKHAANGMEALALLQDFTPDVVLLDLMMPEMNGDEFLAKFREHPQFSTTPVIVLTNMGQEEVPKSVWDHNVKDVIIKSNCTPSEVIERVKSVATTHPNIESEV